MTASLDGQTDSRFGDKVTDLLDRLGRTLRRLEFDGGLNPAHWEALRYLARANHRSRTPGGLAAYLGTTRGTVSQTLNCLESKGLVRKVRCENDRRVTFLELTDDGVTRLADDPLRTVEAVAGELGDGVEGALLDGLNRLLRQLNKDEACGDFGVCEKCGYLREERAEASGTGDAFKCGLTGDPLADGDTDRICINFKCPSEFS